MSFNYDLQEIDQALIREGRCIADIYVPILSNREARIAFPELELERDEYRLAELYAIKNEREVIKTKKQEIGNFGFNKS